MTRFVQLLLVGSLVGCSAAWRAAKEGQEALDRGDLDTAVRQYAAACRQSDDKDWCERADRLYADLKAQLLEEAKPVCGVAGHETRCLELVNRARRTKDDPQLAALADEAGRTWFERCRSIAVATPVDALTKFRCVEAMRTHVDTAAYKQQADQERASLAGFASTEARGALSRGLPANGVGLASLAKCFDRNAAVPVELPQARAELVSRLVLRASLAADGLMTPAQACQTIGALSDGRFVCVSGNGDVGMRVSLGRSQMTHGFSDSEHAVEYVVRRDVYENPEWRRLENLRLAREAELRVAHKNFRLAQDDCETARNDHARAKHCRSCEAERNEEAWCRRANTLRDLEAEARRELDDVSWRQTNTRRELVNEIRDVYRYVRRTHTWEQNYRIAFAGAGVGLESREFVVTFSHTDTEQPGFEPAGVRAESAFPPSQ